MDDDETLELKPIVVTMSWERWRQLPPVVREAVQARKFNTRYELRTIRFSIRPQDYEHLEQQFGFGR